MGRLPHTPELFNVSHFTLGAAMQLSYKGNITHIEAAATEVVDKRVSYHHKHDPTVEMLYRRHVEEPCHHSIVGTSRQTKIKNKSHFLPLNKDREPTLVCKTCITRTCTSIHTRRSMVMSFAAQLV